VTPPPRPRRILRPNLTQPSEVLLERFRSLRRAQDVADLLELDWSQLHYITSRATGRYKYTSFSIPKKTGGVRTIQAPHPTLRILQRKLLKVLELVYQPHPAAQGFVKQRGIVSNATPHVGKRLILNLDLQNFFTSITFPRVRGIFIPPG
jgi:RNA-directed DNA polymerase